MPSFSWSSEFPELISTLSGVAGILALAVDVAVQHDDSRRSRRITGWLAVLLGSGGAAVAAGSGAEGGFVLTEWGDAWRTVLACAGIALAVAGLWRASSLPRDSDRAPVRKLLDALTASLPERLPDYQPLPTVRTEPRSRRRRRLADRVRHTRGALITLYAPRGCGKSVELREAARLLAESARRRRRVTLLPVYLDLADQITSGSAVTVEVLRDLLRAMVRRQNEELVAEIDRHLQGGYEHVDCVVFIDSFDRLAPAARTQAWAALRELANSTGFGVVVAMRSTKGFTGMDERLVLDFGSFRWRRALLTALRFPPEHRAGMLTWAELEPVPERGRIGPYLFRRLAEFVRDTGTVPAGERFHELLDRMIDHRVSQHVPAGVDPSAVRRAAEELAFARVSGTTDVHAPTAEMRTLAEAGLVTDEAGDLPDAFPDVLLQAHLATARLSRVPDGPDAATLLRSEEWRLPVIGLLEHGDADRRDRLLAAATMALETEAASTPGLVADLDAYLNEPAGRRRDAPPVGFRWPPEVLPMLLTLAEGVRYRENGVPDELRVLADRFAVSAFVPLVDPADRKNALSILPLCTERVSLWALKGCLSSRRAHLRIAAAEQLTRLPGVIDRLDVPHRFAALITAPDSPVLIAHGLARGGVHTDPGRRTLADVLASMTRVLQVLAVYLIITAPYRLWNDVSGAPPNWWDAGATAVLPLLALGFLASTLTGDHALRTTRRGTELFLFLVAALGALGGLLSVGPALFKILTGSASEGFNQFVTALLITWPLAMCYRVISDERRPTFAEWLLPHAHLVASVPGLFPRSAYRELANRNSRTVLIAILVVGGLVALANADIPHVRGAEEADVRKNIGGAIVLAVMAGFALRDLWREQADRISLRRTLRSMPDDGRFLDLMLTRRSRKGTQRLLAMLATLPPSAMFSARAALRDLNLALLYVDRYVQPDSKRVINEAVWHRGDLDFVLPDFKEWIIEYDRRNPGRLIWLSQVALEQLAKAIERSQSSPDQIILT